MNVPQLLLVLDDGNTHPPRPISLINKNTTIILEIIISFDIHEIHNMFAVEKVIWMSKSKHTRTFFSCEKNDHNPSSHIDYRFKFYFMIL